MSSIKRRLTPSPSRTPKALRVTTQVRSPLLCTLPPTCHLPNRPTPLSDSRALEAHYATHHAHVCSSPNCGCIFPDERLLELHIAECHDSLAAVRRERGEKTFACFDSTCPRIFANPKARRLHLIATHKYPKEYFFAVTNKGIGGLLRSWGDGASLLRGPWRPRDTEGNAEGDRDEESALPQHSEQDGERDERITAGEEIFAPDSTSTPILAEPEATAKTADDSDVVVDGVGDAEVDDLTRSVSALGLVPSSVRFGRGGPALRGRAGLATRSGRPAVRNIGHPPVANHNHAVVNNKDDDKVIDAEPGESDVLEQDAVVMSDKTSPVRGRRGRGRGSDGRGSAGAGAGRGSGRARGFMPPPPRGGFLLRGVTGRYPRGLIAASYRARGGGPGV